MENILGLLRIHIHRGINLAVRDITTSDPYVVLRLGKQKLKTHVVKKNVNPKWDEDLTFSITDVNQIIKLTVYDKDLFSPDDKMGDAEFDIKCFIEALKMKLNDLPKGTIISKIKPDRENYLSEESSIIWDGEKIIQSMILRLRNVERGEIELQLHWIEIPGSKGL